jgi:hypothetical protein
MAWMSSKVRPAEIASKVVTRQRQVGVYAEEVLAVYAPFAMGVICNIAMGDTNARDLDAFFEGACRATPRVKPGGLALRRPDTAARRF